MSAKEYTHPVNIFFLNFPTGISTGFMSVALPFLLTKNGFPVAMTAGIVAVGLSANLWRFVWGPIVDISLSLRKWYWISLLACISTLMIVCITPFTVKGAFLLTAIIFISQVASTFLLLPINGFMAKSIQEKDKGKASGWYQAGNLGGTGFGGGVGLWLATNYGAEASGIVLAIISILFGLVVMNIKDIESDKNKTIRHEIVNMGKDVLSMVKIPIALFAMILICMPIGTGAMANLWSAIAADWKTDADTVVLVTGILSGVISALGCIAGGYIADRWGIWMAYLGTGIICAVVTLVMALLPMQPIVYIGGVLCYAFSTGLIYAAFTAVLLFAVGKRHVATKFALLASLGNLPVVYMTAFNGWAHDMFNSRYMLILESVIGLLFVFIFGMILKMMASRKLVLIKMDHGVHHD